VLPVTAQARIVEVNQVDRKTERRGHDACKAMVTSAAMPVLNSNTQTSPCTTEMDARELFENRYTFGSFRVASMETVVAALAWTPMPEANLCENGAPA
jgi:hypothetical protein